MLELMDSRDLAQTRTTFVPVIVSLSVRWSTAIFEGAQTRTLPSFCLTKWYTRVVDVTVFPVPGGPYISVRGVVSAFLTAFIWK